MTPVRPVLFLFINGFVASKEEIEEQSKYPDATVYLKNSQMINSDTAIRPADGVFGTVPPQYKEYPSAAEAMAKYRKVVVAAQKASGDKEAPEPVSLPEDREDFQERNKEPEKKVVRVKAKKKT